MNPPTQVTERYLSNLLHYGRNKEFDIGQINRELSRTDDEEKEIVGVFFTVRLIHGSGLEATGATTKVASGATISQALRRALEKHGVTFRS
jgi:hypothetical protein